MGEATPKQYRELVAALKRAAKTLDDTVASLDALAEYGGPLAPGSYGFVIRAAKSARAALAKAQGQ